VQEFDTERVEGAVNVPFMIRGDAGLVPNAKFAGESQFDIPSRIFFLFTSQKYENLMVHARIIFRVPG